MFGLFSILLRGFHIRQPMAVAARSKAWVFGGCFGGIVGSNPAGAWMFLSCDIFVSSGRGPASG